MCNVIQFLEALARDPRLPGSAEYATAVAELEPAARAALLARDPAAIAAALGVPPTVACIIATPESEEPAPEQLPADDDGGDGGHEEAPDHPATRVA